jgi:ABC-type antimicrobial peptide transport system permease subunit
VRFSRKDEPAPWLPVVGVTDELVQSSQASAPDAIVFVPFRQQPPSSFILAVRAQGDPALLANAMRSVVEKMDRDLALFDVQTAEHAAYREQWPYRVFGTIFAVFAASALLMAAIGLYAVMSQSTARRTREIGIRMAIGATPRRILTEVIRRGSIQLAIGLVLGLGGAFLVTEQMRSLLLGVLPTDPVTFASTATVLICVGLLACWLPARRAALTAPVRALAEGERR